MGLIGLPNVGKSTLFNALTRTAQLARAANFPFCTIEPNTAYITVPDPYVQPLAEHFVMTPRPDRDDDDEGTTAPTVRPARIKVIDVAGLVEGASRGEGLGNQFLAVIRECDVIVHVIRYFHDPDIVRHPQPAQAAEADTDIKKEQQYEYVVDPVFDAEIINNELLLADLAHVERRLARIKAPYTSSAAAFEAAVLHKVHEGLQHAIPGRNLGLSDAEQFAIKSMGLLSLKPIVYAFNVDDSDFTAHRATVIRTIHHEYMPQLRYHTKNTNTLPRKTGNTATDTAATADADENMLTDDFVIVSAKLEEELLSLGGPKEQCDYLDELLGTTTSTTAMGQIEHQQQLLSYNVLPKRVCHLLSLSLCYTGPGVPTERSQTTKAYLFHSSSSSASSSMTAFELAGKIHGDLQKGFLCAEVINAPILLQRTTQESNKKKNNNHNNTKNYKFDTYRMAKEAGCVRTEGKEYVIEHNDSILIKWKQWREVQKLNRIVGNTTTAWDYRTAFGSRGGSAYRNLWWRAVMILVGYILFFKYAESNSAYERFGSGVINMVIRSLSLTVSADWFVCIIIHYQSLPPLYTSLLPI